MCTCSRTRGLGGRAVCDTCKGLAPIPSPRTSLILSPGLPGAALALLRLSPQTQSDSPFSPLAHTLRGGRESGLLPPGPASWHLRGLPLHSFPPGQEPGQGYTDQRGKSALRLPGAAFQEEERLAEAHGPTPTAAGAQAGQGPAPHGPQRPQTPPTAQKHKHPPGPC